MCWKKPEQAVLLKIISSKMHKNPFFCYQYALLYVDGSVRLLPKCPFLWIFKHRTTNSDAAAVSQISWWPGEFLKTTRLGFASSTPPDHHSFYLRIRSTQCMRVVVCQHDRCGSARFLDHHRHVRRLFWIVGWERCLLLFVVFCFLRIVFHIFVNCLIGAIILLF